jgi:hypothetical protein
MTDVSTEEIGPADAPTLRRDVALPYYERLDRVALRAKVLQRKRKRGSESLRVKLGGESQPTTVATFEGSVFYMFAAAIHLLNIAASASTRDANGLATRSNVVLVPTAPVAGTPLALRCEGVGKGTRHEARAIVRDVMAGGLDLFCQRTRGTFTAAFDITSEEQLAVAQRQWAWKALTDDLRLRWAYAACRIRYLTT